MPELPLHMLRHTVTVEPALPAPWGGFGTAFEMKCLVVQHTVGRLRKGGEAVRAEANLYAALNEDCPTGSRIVLHDGRAGYATESVRREAGGLATPDHLEVLWASQKAVAPPAGETVVLLVRTLMEDTDNPGTTLTDRYGNDLYTSAETEIDGAEVSFRTSSENRNDGGEQITDVIDVVLPPGTVVEGVDQIRVRGLTYDVEGQPQPDTDPMTGVEAGLKVVARRVH